MSTAPIPVVLCIDVEPDDRLVDPARPARWDGLPATWALIEQARPSLRGAERREPQVSWFVRMDPQVEHVHGRADWVTEAHRSLFASADAHGDAIGLHVHTWRWDPAMAGWVAEYGDAGWVDGCLDMSFEAFRSSMGRPCVEFRFGDRWMDQRTMERLEALGVEVDLTLEPGFGPDSFYAPSDAVRGALPDYRPVPRRPYRPRKDEYRTPDAGRADGIWIMPVTTAPVRPSLAHRVYRRVVKGRPDTAMTTAMLSLSCGVFAEVIDTALRQDEPTLVLTLRTGAATVPRYARRIAANLAWLVARAERQPMVWVTPREAIRRLVR